MSKEKCPACNKTYKKLGSHWQFNPSHRPELTDKQRETAIGIIMGDGSIISESKNNRITMNMVSENYLKYVDSIFGCLGTGVSLKRTAKESAKNSRKYNINNNAKEENYSDVYSWNTRAHPELNIFTGWYKNNTKVWPNKINLTPTTLKHWYCGDGHWSNSGTSNRIKITTSNEAKNTDKIDSMFKNSGLPTPSNYSKYKKESGSINCDICFTVDQSKELWKYMGNPLPDFGYKWPRKYHC